MTYNDFCYAFIDDMLLDPSRVKTTKAIREFAERVPEDALDELSLSVFAPAQGVYGQVHRFPQVVIYLAPSLERRPMHEVLFTIAHEFAHAVLGHHEDTRLSTGERRHAVHQRRRAELEADALAAKWGFKRPPTWTS